MKLLVLFALVGSAAAVRVGLNESTKGDQKEPGAADILTKFANYKKALAKDQAVFVQECAEADHSLSSMVSCGNTVKCFIKLFASGNAMELLNYRLGEKNVKKALSKMSSTAWKDGGVKKVVEKYRIPSTDVRSYFGVTALNAAFVNVEGGRQFLVDVARASLDELSEELFKLDKEEDLPRVFIPYFSWTALDGGAQNHIFAIVKRSNENFSILQGYIRSEVEQGYDLSDWLCSRNPFANINGFGRFTMAKAIDHFNTLANAETGKTFDGENHAALFLVREKNFEGKEYLPTFAWFEVDRSDIDPNEKVKAMVSDADAAKFQEQCQDMEKIHQGHLMPGETLQARPGQGLALSSDKPEEWSLNKKVGLEVYKLDTREAQE